MAINVPQKQRLYIPDINILPEEYRRPAISSLTFMLLLIVLFSVFGMYKLLPLRSQAAAERTSLEVSLAANQQELKSLQALEPQVKDLKDTIAKLESTKQDYQSAWDIFQKNQVKWRLILDGIQGTIPQGVTIDSVLQKEFTVTVHGLAPNLNSVLTYANTLRLLSLTQDLGVTYEIRPEGNISFNLNLIVRLGGNP